MSRFEEISFEIGKLVTEKNAAYGDSFGKCGEFLKLLFPDGISPDRYSDALCLVRIFDKCCRIATNRDAFGESPYRDIAGYAILGAAKDEHSAVDALHPNSTVAETLARVIIEHTHDNNTLRETLRECVGGG